MLDSKPKREHRVTTVISEQDWEILNKLCEYYGLNRSEVVRQILSPGLMREWEEI